MTGLPYMSKTFQYIRTRTSANTGLNFLKSRRTLQQVPANTSASPKALLQPIQKNTIQQLHSQLSIINYQLSIKKEPRSRFQIRSLFCVLPSAFASVPADKNFFISILYIINIKQTAFASRRVLFPDCSVRLTN